MAWKLLPNTRGAALFHKDDDGLERRRSLHRDWQKPGEILKVSNYDSDTLVCIGMNPCVSNATEDSYTIRKEYTFAQQFTTYTKYTKFNVCDLISPKPKDLLTNKNPSSRGNHRFIIDSLRNMHADIVLSWGNLPGDLEYLADELLVLLRKEGYMLYCFGVNLSGMPKHPRFLKSNEMKLQRFF
jgi:hypothetical protein